MIACGKVTTILVGLPVVPVPQSTDRQNVHIRYNLLSTHRLTATIRAAALRASSLLGYLIVAPCPRA
jgi:hypothetical protein